MFIFCLDIRGINMGKPKKNTTSSSIAIASFFTSVKTKLKGLLNRLRNEIVIEIIIAISLFIPTIEKSWEKYPADINAIMRPNKKYNRDLKSPLKGERMIILFKVYYTPYWL
uniref:Orf c05016 protein n=1 Tax=Saccharolobus solfataricus TaxID=2287 RepID=P96005_SACSO|nr:orf c05016 [Saccharolobus solfataricus P2]